MEYKDLKSKPQAKEQIRSCSNELGQLAQDGKTRILTGSNTIHFIHPWEKPTPRQATYLRIISELEPYKEGKYRVRFTVDGNRMNYPGVVTTSSTEL